MTTVKEAKASLASTSRTLAQTYSEWAKEGGKDSEKWRAEYQRLTEQAEWFEKSAETDIEQ